MAEIKIEKKKSVWPWIVVILLVSAIIYYIFLRDNETQSERGVDVENTTSINETSN